MPIDFNLVNNPLCQTRSNALLTSQKTTLTSFPSSSALPNSLIFVKYLYARLRIINYEVRGKKIYVAHKIMTIFDILGWLWSDFILLDPISLATFINKKNYKKFLTLPILYLSCSYCFCWIKHPHLNSLITLVFNFFSVDYSSNWYFDTVYFFLPIPESIDIALMVCKLVRFNKL